MNFQRLIFNFTIGIEAIMANKSRALLTSLGIIFGVAAVIAMLSIGAGAEREILQQMKEAGSNNIIIKPKTASPGDEGDDKVKKKYSPGLSLRDAENIRASLPGVRQVSPEIEMETGFLREGIKYNGKLVGVNIDYFEIANLGVSQGRLFTDLQMKDAEPVCIIGKTLQARFFPKSEPIGQYIKCGHVWLKVIGVLDMKSVSEKSQQNLSIRNDNTNVYIPISTYLLRYNDRSRVTQQMMQQATFEGDSKEKKALNANQIDRLVVRIDESEMMEPSVEIIREILSRRHNQVEDTEIIIPEVLLKQEQRTKRLFNLVLGIIASISLLVGGIGIMNIMLASVLERIKEIGLRQSLGATRRDILFQFVSEAVAISVSGGIIGILLGLTLSFVIRKFADIQTVVSGLSVLVSFSVSIAVGLIFGIFPARKASQKDPVESLRYE